MIKAIKNAIKYKYFWIWKFLIHWMSPYAGERHIDIGFYPNYEDILWSVNIKFNHYNEGLYKLNESLKKIS